MKVDQRLIEKVKQVRKAKGQKGMILTHTPEGKLIKFRIIYSLGVFDK